MNWWDIVPIVNTIAITIIGWFVADRRHLMKDITEIKERVIRIDTKLSDHEAADDRRFSAHDLDLRKLKNGGEK